MNKKHHLTSRVIAKILLVGIFLQSCGTYLNAPFLQLEGNSKQNKHCSTDLIAIHELENQEFTAEGGYLVNFHAEDGKLEADVSVERNQKVPNYKNLPVVIEPGTNLVRLSRLASNVQQSHIKFQSNKGSQLNRICIFKGGIVGGMMEGETSRQGTPRLTDIKELRKYFYKGYLEITPRNYQDLINLTKKYEIPFTNYGGGVFVKGWDTSDGCSELADLLLSFSRIQKFKINCVKKADLELAEVLIRAVQFYEDLAELDLTGCELADAMLQDILESIPCSEKVRLFQVGDMEFSKELAALIEERFVEAQIRTSSNVTPTRGTTRELNNSAKTQASFPSPDLTAYGRLHLNRFLPVIPEKDIIYGKQLGIGAMGIVFEATYQGNTVAVKKLLRFRPEEIASFQKEAIIMANHRHKNIVMLVGFCPTENAFVMEYLPGGSLWSLLKSNEELSWQTRYQIALDIAEGLNYLHECGIIHRDLKSLNILLDSERRAKVADFGISVLKSENSTFGAWKDEGTLCWIAPEIFHVEKNTKAGDVYSYGMVLWQLGARKEPFATINNVFQLYDHIKAGNREVISDDTPPELKNVIELCWLPEPPLKKDTDSQQRPTMKEVRYLLESVLKKEDEKEKITSTKEIKEKLFLELLNQAQEGDLKAQYEVGIMYAKGEGTLPNEEEAVNWYRKAAEKGYVYAEANLGIMYQHGKGVLKDEQEAVNWYKKAAEKGYALAQCNLGFMYQNGRGGCDQNEHEALEWYKKAAAQDHKVAQYNLGCMYQNGRGVPKNDIQARLWYEKSAQQGYASAQSKLATMIAKGEGGAKDEKQAKSWFEKAAVQGDSFAQEQLRLLKLYELTKHPNYNFGIGKDNQQGHVKRILTGLSATSIRLPDAIATGDIKEVEKSISFLMQRGLDINVINTKGYSPIHLAIEKGSLEIVKLLIDSGADVNIVDRDGNTPLLMAFENGSKEDIVRFLIEKGAHVNVVSKNGNTPFHWAANAGYLYVIDLLIGKGVEIKRKNKNGSTALHLSSAKGYVELTKLLIEKEIEVNAINNSNNTPLHEAAKGGYLDVIKLLIEKGAKVNVVDNLGDSSLHKAASEGHLDVVKLLIDKGAEVNVVDNLGDSPLHKAASEGHLDMVKLLIDRGAEINAISKDGYTPLYGAISKIPNKDSKEEIARILIDKGAKLTTIDHDYNTLLHHAVKNGYKKVVELLLINGMDIDSKNKDGNIPLNNAIASGEIEIARLLIKKGADLNTKDNNGNTLLHQAVTGYNSVKMLELLLQNGASIHTKNDNDETPLGMAMRLHNLVPINLRYTFWDKYPKISSLLSTDWLSYSKLELAPGLCTAAANGDIESVVWWIEEGANINQPDDESLGDTPLHHAVISANLDVIKFLIENGANIQATNPAGYTPLHSAIESEDLSIIEFLIEHGAKVDAVNKNGSTSLHFAAGKGLVEVAKLLIDKGADMSIIDTYGWSPLHIAVYYSSLDVVKLLLEKGVNVNSASPEHGWTALHWASHNGNEAMVSLLLEKSANIDFITKNSHSTPLHLAAQNGHISVVKLLLQKGANPNLKDKDDNTALNVATEKKHLDVVELLKSN